ncbi:hypothetical protein ACFYXV_32060 [Streptomyces sp. NPDC002181]
MAARPKSSVVAAQPSTGHVLAVAEHEAFSTMVAQVLRSGG